MSAPWTERWLADFAPYSVQHAATLLVFGLAMGIGIAVGYKTRGTSRERTWRMGWAGIAILTQSVELCWWCHPARFDAESSLPMALCDIMAWVACFWLLSREGTPHHRVLSSIMYFGGLCLSSQAFLTPVLKAGEGMGTVRYWFFFIGHTHIVGAALYGLIVLRYRPDWRACRIAILCGMCYVIAAVTANVLIGGDANYGFLGKKESQPAVVKLAGPYPWKILWMSIVVILLFVFFTLPWVLVKRWKPSAATASLCQ